jgi:hypothetical protein
MIDKMPEIELVVSTQHTSGSIKKLRGAWTVEISPWSISVCGINDPDNGFWPGSMKIHSVTGETYGIQPENPQDPRKHWRWVGFHRDPDGTILPMSYEEAYEKIFDNLE